MHLSAACSSPAAGEHAAGADGPSARSSAAPSFGVRQMTKKEKWPYLVELDEALLKGGVILSEWATFLIKDADIAFVSGAHLASIITALAGIETHLRSEGGSRRQRLVDLIEQSDLEEDLKQELQTLRKYRNNWVHVAEPWEDGSLLDSPEQHEAELEEIAKRCVVALRRTIYANPWI